MSQDKPHDSLFRFAWSNLATARSHFENVLPPALVARLDWGTLTLDSGSFVDEAFRDLHSDLLFEIRTLDGQPVLLYLLFEHQSSMDPKMAFRLLLYMSRIWEHHQRKEPKAKKLPPILPLVLYHGAARWTAAQEFSQLIDADEELRQTLQPYLPTFQYLLEDLSTVPDENLRGTALGRMVLLLFKHAAKGDIWDHFVKWLDTVAEILTEGTSGLRAVEALFRYIVSITPTAPPPEVREALRRRLGPQLEGTLVSWGEQLRQEGLEKGLEKGREEGREEGRMEADRRSILQVLTLRFPKADWSDMNDLLLGKGVVLLEEIRAISVQASSARQFRTQLAEKLGGQSAS